MGPYLLSVSSNSWAVSYAYYGALVKTFLRLSTTIGYYVVFPEHAREDSSVTARLDL